ncbi:transmembrane protein 184 homolog [[Candida] jaroonii]|uniref:Transmembrane protein 184 homolog n=1 Tax=[Candida] jaroonii TaxID=467808 RepID=A0ACA9Y016_9ASCO|nr:transmembrane protein 184 homolog [[Candida] jaroonii]
MIDDEVRLPHWVYTLSFYSSIISSLIVVLSIFLHLMNYRRPFQQRLMIRIQLIIPLFALSCYCMLINSESYFNKFILEPVREIYEAFVIYTFFSLLSDMLGGERAIIIRTSGRKPVSHPGLLKYVFHDVDISDSTTFLIFKRGILQYVWIKPFLCFGILFTEFLGVYNINAISAESMYLWLMIIYNTSVSISLYCLAMFWKILWDDLKPFNPVGKFLCVKLIIFASYWQGILLAILNYFGLIPGSENTDASKANSNIGLSIQNALLCFELIFFAAGHWVSFTYKPFTLSQIPNARLKFYYALRDMFGIKDLIQDFKLTFYGDHYKDYKAFDSVNALVQHPSSKSRMKKINQGLRYHFDGKHKHWVAFNHNDSKSIIENATIGSDSLYAPSINTSTRGIHTTSPKSQSPPTSPVIGSSIFSGSEVLGGFPITESLNNEEFNYDNEMLEEDENFYHSAYNTINNYRLDQTEVKEIINYPVVENIVDSHLYGYKVRKLRESRKSSVERGRSLTRSNYDYGSV